MRLGIEKEISPEKLQGRPFQQPIIKPRFGSGFEIQGLALPIGWEKGVNPLIDNPATFNEGYFRAMLKRYYFPEEIEGKVVMDDNINLPSFISISTTPESYLILSKEPGNESSGCYISNTTNLEAAFALIQAVSFFLDDARKQLEDENNKISYVEHYENQFEPRNLGFRSDSIPLSSNGQERFTEEAKKIATDFGLEI
ncbi:hypothetical protein KKA69_02440, partial [Patescibacteria group bacterium]|nr:hypothetical protein [Patescibacteria group bacterium]